MKITNDVSNVLANSKAESNKLYLPEGQLERKLYMAVDKCLKALGGKWNRSAKAHIFQKDVEFIVEEVVLTGEYTVVGDDFINFSEKYDVIVANPPFTKQSDIFHINHMIELAKRRVVSIASSSVLFRDNKKTIDFRNRITDLGGTITPLTEKSFAESGTNVNTCIVCVDVEH
jgi:type I restriction-modification system DNA methylase subunit